MENWNDDRLDELSGRMDTGFKEMREGFARIDARLDQVATRKEVQAVDGRLFTLTCALIAVIGGIIGTLIVVNAS